LGFIAHTAAVFPDRPAVIYGKKLMRAATGSPARFGQRGIGWNETVR
jgi:hypothetical protein